MAAIRNRRLDRLFDEWIKTYPADPDEVRLGFHRDGIICEDRFLKESCRILFVLLEANSRGGRYDRFFGKDLREVFGGAGLRKELHSNIALWTNALLDGSRRYRRLSCAETETQAQRVSILNLKKLGGSGKAGIESISIQAWRDRDFIRREVAIISPDLIVTCGPTANCLFHWIVKDDFLAPVPEADWSFHRFKVLPGNHPSLRPRNAEEALERLVVLAEKARVGAFAPREDI